MESIKQQKVARLVQRELGEYFQKNAGEYLNAFINVTVVRMSPDLSVAKVYISLYSPNHKPNEIFDLVEINKKNIRYALGQRIRNKVRIIPELIFYIDDSYDYAKRIEELLKK